MRAVLGRFGPDFRRESGGEARTLSFLAFKLAI